LGSSLTILLIAFAALVGFFLFSRLGWGRVDERIAEFIAQKPLLDENALEVIAELPVPPGNLAVSTAGQVFFSFHPSYNSVNPTGVKIAIVVQGGGSSFEAWPTIEFQRQVVSVLSLRIQPGKNILYLLDHCEMGFLCRPTLTGLSINSKAVVSKHVFEDSVAGRGSFLNDFQIDPRGEFMYFSDTSILAKTPSLIVYDVQRDSSYRVLSEHPSMFGESLFLQMQGSQVMLRLGPFGFTTHVDGISLSRDGETLTYSAVTSHDMYAVPTKALRERSEARAQVRLVSRRKPVSDGQATDTMGNIWLTAFTENALAVLRPVTNELVKVVESTKLRWCDGLSFGPDGLYVTESVLHLFLFGSGAFLEKNRPFHIYKLDHAALQFAFSEEYTLPPAGQ
jgi:sugar lactone lactonase YvrE